MKSPFIHKFGVNGKKYIYDVNSNEFVNVSGAVFDMIDYVDYGENCVLDRFKSRYPIRQLKRSFFAVEKLRENSSIFNTNRPDRCSSKLLQTNPSSILEKTLRNICLCVTERCNLRCSYCIYSGSYTGRRSHTTRNMSFEVARKAIDYLIDHSYEQEDEISVSFYGGEPLLNFDLIKKCVSYFKKRAGERKHLFTITTNGTILSDEIVDFLVSNRFYVIVSLDGPKVIHDRNRKYASGKGSYSIVLEFLEKIRKADPFYYSYSISTSTVLTTKSDLAEMDAFFNKLGITTRVSTVETYGRYPEKEITEIFSLNGYQYLRNKFAEAAINEWFYDNTFKPNPDFSFAKSFFYIPLKKIHLRDRHPKTERHWRALGNCIPGATKLFVSVEGKLYVCEKVDGYENMCIGDVDSGIDLSRVTSIIKSSDDMMDECRNCWMVRLCSLCHFSLVFNGNYDIDKMRFVCRYIRRLYHDMLKLYVYIMEKNENAFDFIDREEDLYKLVLRDIDEQSLFV